MNRRSYRTITVLVLTSACVMAFTGCGDDDEMNGVIPESQPALMVEPAPAAEPQPTVDPNSVEEPMVMDEQLSALTLTSSAFVNEAVIPSTHACANLGGDNVSPPLAWSGVPEGTPTFALLMDDEVPPCGTGTAACRHWQVYNIPADTTSLAEGQDVTEIPGVTQGVNWNNSSNYTGPCPPSTHTYNITIFALDASTRVIEEGTPLTRSQFQSDFENNILGSATLSGTFSP